jgi:hypothetical protein
MARKPIQQDSDVDDEAETETETLDEFPPQLTITLDDVITVNGTDYTEITLTPPTWKQFKMANSKKAGINGDAAFATEIVRLCSGLDAMVIDALPLWVVEAAVIYLTGFSEARRKIGKN